MGNKPTKALYKSISKISSKDLLGVHMNLLTLGSKEITNFIKESQVEKVLKGEELQSFDCAKDSNIPKDYYTQEKEAKKKKHREMLKRSILVAGHEQHSQVDFIIEGLEEPPEEYLKESADFTSNLTKEFAAFLLLLLNLKEKAQQFLPYEQRLLQCIRASSSAGEGASAALNLVSLLLDQRQIQEDNQIVNQTLMLFKDIPILGLYGWTMQSISVEKAIGRVKEYIVKLLKTNNEIELLKNAVLALCHIGFATGALEDILLAIYYTNTKNLHININDILNKIEGLEVNHDQSLTNFDISSKSIKESFPLEIIYTGVSKAEYRTIILSSTTDGEFIYLYSSFDGLLVLGAGKNKVHGELYFTIPINTKDTLQLLCIDKEPYAVIKNEVLRVDVRKGELKKSFSLPENKVFKVTSWRDNIILYNEEEDEVNRRKNIIKAHISYYSVKTKKIYKECKIVHGVIFLREVVVYGSVIVLINFMRYEIYDLESGKKIKEGDSDILSRATICVNSETGEFYAIYLKSQKEGLWVARFEAFCIESQERASGSEIQSTDSESIKRKAKKEVSTLLGFYVAPIDYNIQSDVQEKLLWDKLLGIVTKRAVEAARTAKNSSLKQVQEVFKAFKSPLGINLSRTCIETLLDFLQYFYKDKGVNLLNIVKLLNAHIQAMQTCEFTLKAFGGSSLVQKFTHSLQDIIKPIITDEKSDRALVKECESLVKNAAVIFLDDYKKVLEMVISIIENESEDRESIMTAATWLNSQKNQMLVAEKLFDKNNRIAIKFIDTYFLLEEKYLTAKIQMFLNKQSKDINYIEFTKNELSFGIRTILEKSFAIFMNKVNEKNVQDIVAFDIFPMFITHLINSIKSIQEGYIEFKLGNNKVIEYWRYLDLVFNKSLMLPNTIPLITYTLLGVTFSPSQSLHLSHTFLSAIDLLKSFTALISDDKKLMVNKELIQFIEVTSGDIAKGIILDKDYEFPFATSIHVTTIIEADFPSPNSNCITLNHVKSGAILGTISHESPYINKILHGSKLKISVKIGQRKDALHIGCKLQLKPKYFYAQKKLKEILRRLIWSTCYLSKTAITFYDIKLLSKKSQAENIGSAISLFCGSLPLSTLHKLFSEQFNTQFQEIIKVSKLDIKEIFEEKENIDGVITEVYNGIHDNIINKLRRKQDITADTKVTQIVRITFALLLKIAHAENDFKEYLKGPLQTEKIVSLYRTANKMKNWYVEKKQVLAELSEEEFEKTCKDILNKIQEKVDFLFKFNYCAPEEQKELREASRGICKINLIQQSIDFLQSDMTVEQVTTELERCYLQGMTLLGSFNVCNKAFKGIKQKTTCIDTLAWINNVLRRKDANYWYYGSILACGITYQSLLRVQLFDFLGEALKMIKTCNDNEKLVSLLEMLKWNYTAYDHHFIQQLDFLKALRDGPETKIGRLWGAELDSQEYLPEMLLDTFEYIVIKTVLQSTKQIKSDSEATMSIIEQVFKIILEELNKAALSYQNCQGVSITTANKYGNIRSNDKLAITSDSKRVQKMFWQESSDIYSPDFCVRLLRIFYHLSVSATNNFLVLQTLILKLNLLVLFELLELGSAHQQFLVLQILPHLVTLTYDTLEKAAEEYLSRRKLPCGYTESKVLDVLIDYTFNRRASIWEKGIMNKNSGYTLSKCAIRVLQHSLNASNKLADALRSIMKIIIFGTVEEVHRLPKKCQSLQFAELMLSVAGGEFASLHKGATGQTKDNKPFAVIAFGTSRIDPTKETVCEWEFLPKIHDQVLIHLVNEEGTVTQMPVYELAPSAEKLYYTWILNNVNHKQITNLLQRLLKPKTSFATDTVLETLKVKLLKSLMQMLGSNEELCQQVFCEEMVLLLLTTALQPPKVDTSKSLLMVELSAEEMRKVATQNKKKALSYDEGKTEFITRKGTKLMLTALGVKVPIRLYSYVNIERIEQNARFEFILYDLKKTSLTDCKDKLVFIKLEELDNIPIKEIIKTALAVIIPKELEMYAILIEDIEKVTLLQVNHKDITNLEDTLNYVRDGRKKLRTENPKNIISEYIHVSSNKDIKANTLKGIVRELIISDESTTFSPNKEDTNKFKSHKDVFDILATPSDRREAIFKDCSDFLATDEQAVYSKEYSMLFKQVHEKGEEATPETYLTLLHDLHVFYSRHLLLTLLIRNEEKIKGLDVELYKRLLTFLLISSAEADLMKLAVQNKELSQQLNKLLLVTLKREDAVDVFLSWTHERIMDAASKGKVLSYSIYNTPQSQLEKNIYLPFICRYVKLMLRNQGVSFMQSKGIGTFIDDMMTVVIMAEKITEKFRAIGVMRTIISTTSRMLHDLPLNCVERILGCESIKSFALYFNHSEPKQSIIWRIANEILLKANVLSRTAAKLYQTEIQIYYSKSSFRLFVASEVMKEFPKITLTTSYIWAKNLKKELKSKEVLCISTPATLYDTQYSVLLTDPYASSLEVEAKKLSHKIALVSLDKDGCAELPSIEKDKTKFTVPGNSCYVQFPCDTYATYAFGSSEGGKLGIRDLKTDEPQLVHELGNLQIKAIVSGGKHTCAVTNKNQLYTTGKGNGKVGPESNVFQLHKAHGASNCIATSEGATIYYDLKGGSMHAIGKNPNKMFISEAEVLTSEATIKPQETNITQISMSSAHILVLYNERQVFGSPWSRKELFSSFAEEGDDFCMIHFGEEIDKVYKVLAVSCGTIILCLSRISGHKELYSFGLLDSPVLGQCDHHLVDEYGRLEYPQGIEFVNLTGNDQMAAAITSKGELFTWGCGELGITSFEGNPLDFSEMPTKVLFLEGYNVLEVSVGASHMVVLAVDNESKKRVFAFGSNVAGELGSSFAKANTWIEIDFFTDKKPYRVCAGENVTFVCCGEETKGITHKGTICSYAGTTPIKDILFFRVDQDGFQCWSKDIMEFLPPLVMVTKNPINNIEDKPWYIIDDTKLTPATQKDTCDDCKKLIKEEPVYRSAVEEYKRVLCEQCFLKTSRSFETVVYYRFALAEQTAELPLYSLSTLYDKINDGLALAVTAMYKYELPPSIKAKVTKPKLEDYLAEFEIFEQQDDLDILDLVNDLVVRTNGKVESLKGDLLLEYKKKRRLRRFSEDLLKQRTKVLIKFNKIIRYAIDYINFALKSDFEDDLYTYYTKLKGYVLLSVKDQIVTQALLKAPEVKGRDECIVERSKAFALNSLGQVDHTGTKSVFGQLWQQLKNRVELFKKHPKDNKFPFNVTFKNEGGIDAGGLFRETLDQLCDELQSGCLPLLIPTPNNRSAFGEYREKWTVNSSANNETNFEMYKFMGALIGMSFRLGHLLPLNLSSLFWKRLTGDVPDRTDLNALDEYCIKYIDDILNINKKGIDEKTFGQIIDITFTTRLSDGSEVDLIPNGKCKKVTFENRIEYTELVEKVRLEEGLPQIKAIASGVFKIVPSNLLRLYSWNELEDKICGKPSFSVEALKKITRYGGCSEKEPFVQYFWQALEEFTDKERSAYLRFVWGRSRMPSYTEKYSHEIHLMRASDPDNRLPVAHTCSFQLDLPKYSSVEKAKERLRIAIKWQTIDADRENYETWTDYN